MEGTNHADRLSRPRPTGPANVIPFLTAPRPRRGSGPAELADALRRVHLAGLRGGFVLLIPTAAGTEPDSWRRLGDRIAAQTPLRVALLGVERRSESPSVVRDCRKGRCVILPGFPRGRRSVLLELARAVCSDDPCLLAKTRAMGMPAFRPEQLVTASSDGTLSELLEHPITRTLPVSA